MKKLLKLIPALAILIMIIPSCQQQTDVKTMLDNDETRNQLYEVILSNHRYSEQMIQAMMENDHTQMMMMGNSKMMNMIMSDSGSIMNNHKMMYHMMGKMMNAADRDSSICSNMIDMMKDKTNMMEMMMEMMNKEGLMDGKTMKNNKELLQRKIDHTTHHN